MSADLLSGLSADSKEVINNYLQWSKTMRDKSTRDAEYEASTFREGNLFGASFNQSDVLRLLNGQLAILTANFEKNDATKTTATAELCRGILREADKYSVPLKLNFQDLVGNIANQNAMKAHETNMLGGGPGRLGKLAPIGVGSAATDDAKRLAEAQAEIMRLREKMLQMQQQINAVMGDKSNVNAHILGLQDTLTSQMTAAQQAQALLEAERARGPQIVTVAGQSNTNAVVETKTVEVSSAVDQRMIANLRQEIANLNRDLTAKLNQSSQFVNLKKMLTDKNEQVRALRKRLALYDPTFAASQDDDLVEEEDD